MASSSRTAADLAKLVDATVTGDPSVTVRDVTHDSRQAGPGTLFVAITGTQHDGHEFVGEAVAAGSPAVMLEHPVDVAVTQLRVADSRAAMAPVAASVFDHPSGRLSVVGVTGTNGKTTVTHMIEAIVDHSGSESGLIGTVHTRVGDQNIPNTRTTPESSDFQRLLARMADLGAEIVAAEVSSHALEMHRVDATRFAVAAFTNLSQDHLDFHGDMDSYAAAKARLFDRSRSSQAVVFVDDPTGERLAGSIEIPVTRVGSDGDVTAVDVRMSVRGSRFVIRTTDGERSIEMSLGGRFNVDNALVAAACALRLGVSLDEVATGLTGFEGVPGRFEVVSGDHPIRVIVDYAHTPAGIVSAVQSARAGLDAGRVLVVFGAGGDRDTAKRPQMGSAAETADEAIVTSDNPRSEDPDSIIEAILSGMSKPDQALRRTDRREAIRLAMGRAEPGDVVLILGRGHERGQEVSGRSLPFDDRLVAREVMAELEREGR